MRGRIFTGQPRPACLVAAELNRRFGAKERLHGSFVKTLGSSKVGQTRDVGHGRIASYYVHGLSQGNDLQISAGALRGGNALPLRLKHLSGQDMGKIARRRLCIGLPGAGQRSACTGGNRCGRQKVQFRFHRITIPEDVTYSGKYKI